MGESPHFYGLWLPKVKKWLKDGSGFVFATPCRAVAEAQREDSICAEKRHPNDWGPDDLEVREFESN